MSTTHYRIRAFDPNDSWNQVALLTDRRAFGQFSFVDTFNKPGAYSLHIPALEMSVLRDYISTDLLFAFDRKVISNEGILLKDWYTPFWGLHRTPTYQNDDVGSWYFKSFGFSATELLTRREIWYYAGSSQAAKSGVGETVMKEFVDENIGPNALMSNGRLKKDGAMAGFTVETDGAAGSSWAGAKAYDNLLDALQDLIYPTGIDFKVVVTSPGNWEFRTRARPWGIDRSTIGLDRSTGLNGNGNTPLIFSAQARTLRNVSYSGNRTGEENAMLILGPGRESDRQIGLVENTTFQGASPINQREGSKNATGEGQFDAYVTSSEGDTLLENRGPQESLSFDMVQTEGHRWGIDYQAGDLVQIRIEQLGFDFPVQITAVDVTFDDSQEDVDHEVLKW